MRTAEWNAEAGETIERDMTPEEEAAREAEIAEAAQPMVPQSVTMRQAKRALLQQGKYAAVEAVIDSLPSPQQEEARIDWTSARDVEYDSPMVAFMVQVLPLSESEKDDLFILAATL